MLLGQMLLQDAVVTAPQLEECIKAQVIFGGKLGSIMLELGYLSEEQLLHYLSTQSGLPIAPTEALERIEPHIIDALPLELAEQYSVVPFALTGRQLMVVMLNPKDLNAIDEMSFKLGMIIRPHLASEIRLIRLLEHYYQIKPDIRRFGINIAGIAHQLRPAAPVQAPSSPPVPVTLVDNPAHAPVLATVPPDAALPAEEELVIDGLQQTSEPLELTEEVTPQAGQPEASTPPSTNAIDDTLRAFLEENASPEPASHPTAKPPTQEDHLPPAPPVPPPVARKPDTAPPVDAPPIAEPHTPVAPPRNKSPFAPPPPVILDPAATKAELKFDTLELPQAKPLSISQQQSPALQRALQLLAGITHRDQIGAIVLEYALSLGFDRAGLFSVRGSTLNGWLSDGVAISQERLQHQAWPLDTISLFTSFMHSPGHYCGPPMVDDNRALFEFLAIEPLHCCICPIRIGTRVVAFLYADILDSDTQPEVDELMTLLDNVQFAFTLLIERHKQEYGIQ